MILFDPVSFFKMFSKCWNRFMSWDRFQISAYFRVDKSEFKVYADFVTLQFSAMSTAGGEASVLNIDRFYKPSVLKEQYRFQIFSAYDEKDVEFELPRFRGTVDACTLSKRGNFVARMAAQSFSESLKTNFSCPFPENYQLILTNWTITDNFIPPLFMPRELFTRSLFDVFGVVKGQKKWTRLYSIELFARVKK